MARSSQKARRKARQSITGTLSVSKRGYGFVNTAEGEFFILPSKMNGAMHGDLVEVRQYHERPQQKAKKTNQGLSAAQSQDNRGPLGTIVRVIDRSHQTLVGVLADNDGLLVVSPLDERIPYDVFIDPRLASKPADAGSIVVVRLNAWPSKAHSAVGYIEEVLGASDGLGVDMDIVLRKHGITTVFPAAVLEEAQALLSQPAPVSTSLHRRDLSDIIVFTIDPDDAQDFDDALSLEYIDGKLLLGVHIADVSAYVALESAIETEALQRGTSVYLPNQVVPMLPEELSNDLCSLKPGEGRLCMSVMMVLSPSGSVESVDFFPSIIKSSARLTYDQVDDFLNGEKDTDQGLLIGPEVGQRLKSLDRIARRLKSRRLARGAIDFDSVEANVVLDQDGKAQDVVLRKSTAATSLVEEAMILANEQVAAYMVADEYPMLYRIHEDPAPAAMQKAIDMLYDLHLISQPSVPVNSKETQKVIQSSLARDGHLIVINEILHVMKRARYSPVFLGHYGLASKAYCHFTSPIRRYPDLLVHHLLKMRLSGIKPPAKLVQSLDYIANQSSESETTAEAASREATNIKIAEYLADRVGDVFDVLIVGASNTGIFVRDEQTSAEGLVPKDSLPAKTFYQSEMYGYADEDGDLAFVVGQRIHARLVRADVSQGELDFDLL
ncbi:MAG: VacB/RNase II family 3'-5' exoribonuclease [Coriobacteriia bacterium]|nr:VacB/RNase II family 3'-5' exoribonuclease [Coriobacteriia bacterium]